jgi:hypothetical protein
MSGVREATLLMRFKESIMLKSPFESSEFPVSKVQTPSPIVLWYRGTGS